MAARHYGRTMWLALTLLAIVVKSPARGVYLNKWAVQVHGGKAEADRVAGRHGFRNLGQIGSLDDYYLFEHHHVEKRSLTASEHHHSKLQQESSVRWAEQQKVKKRVKRDFVSSGKAATSFNDPLWPYMWYLHHGASGGYDMNVAGAWSRGYTGRGVVVTILDDGIEYTHDDLKQNYDPEASLDINGGDSDPIPRYDDSDENRHGTRCAGEVAAQANNSKCIVGVAYNANIGGVRMLDGDVSDFVEAQALSLNPQHVDIYSASWGPDDNGKVVDGPAKLAKEAFIQGVLKGRGGKGSIYVWASGNGGSLSDSCSCDGYTNSIFTLSVSSASEHNSKPWYLEECASTLATTYSSGENYREKKVVTTDLHNGCTDKHTGTSASAPIAAAMCALALEANPALTWRDMQYIVLMTSVYYPLSDGDWVTNGVGRYVSHKYGFGLMDGEAMVDLAERWTTVPEQRICISDSVLVEESIEGQGISLQMDSTGCAGTPNEIAYLEHVQAKVSLTFSRRGDLQLHLRSPNGTRSTILPRRKNDFAQDEFKDWPFMSVFYWGESPIGRWTLDVENTGSNMNAGFFLKWQLILYGTASNPVNLKAPPTRKRPLPEGDHTNSVEHEKEFDWGEKQGHKCHPLCAPYSECSGPGPEDCHECLHVRLSYDGPCVEVCPEGGFLDMNTGVCEFCPPPCQKCKGPDVSSDCTSCLDGYLLVPDTGSCVLECPLGHYTAKHQKVCVPCPDHCTSCPESPHTCALCEDNYEILESGAVCSPHCSSNHFRNSLLQCKSCDVSCDTCVGPSSKDCLRCASGFVRQRDECRHNCSFGFFLGPDSKECLMCHPTCKMCFSSDSTSCVECYTPYKLTQKGTCEESCSPGAFDYAGRCESCHTLCATCKGPNDNDCLSCHHNRFLHEGSCLTACPERFFPSSSSCLPCLPSCASCSDSFSCDHCPRGLLKTPDGECLSHCRPGEYQSPDSPVCLRCHDTCASCLGPSPSHCFHCHDDAYLHQGACLGGCPDGFYTLANECRKCQPPCNTCVAPGADNCLSCMEGFEFEGGVCMERPPDESLTCVQRQFYDADAEICAPCDSSCETCSGRGSHHCLSCSTPLLFHAHRHQCLACCPAHHEVTTYTECCICPQQGTDGTCREVLQLFPPTSSTPHTSPTPSPLPSISPSITSPPAVSRAVSTWKNIITIIVILCLLSTVVFCVVFGVLQARAHERLCWRHKYQPVPMHYHNGHSSKVVSLASPAYDDEDDEDEVFSSA